MSFQRRTSLSAFLSIFIFIIFFSGLTISAERAVIKEEMQEFKTYPFSDPDPVPRMGNIYPYYRFDGYSRTGKNQQWKVIGMENPYIKVVVAPQIGGKVWGAVEKSSNRAFIYYNKVVKFRDIAMRGPWTSGGIEFNFGAIGHSPTTATPVDYLIKENSDGSVGCIVGAMDLPSRTRWRVNIRLPKDKAYFETESTWYNPGPLHQSYYHWTNAAADIGEDLHFHYPGTFYIDHGGNAFSWPIDEKGRNISIYANNNFGSNKSYHVLGQYTEHFGGYWKHSDFGFGHWSFYDHKPGKKLWLWALSRQGAIWKDLLTDQGNKQYIEFQSGRLLNQAGMTSSQTPFKHAYFAPFVFDKWSETWFPVKGIGGMVNCSPYGSLNVTRTKKGLEIGICPLQHLEDDLVVTIAGEKVYSKHLVLKPMEVYLGTVPLPSREGKIVVTVGENKLGYSSTGYQDHLLHRPVRTNSEYDWTSAEGLFTAGEEWAKQRRYGKALGSFLACLKKELFHLRALARIAELYFRGGDYKKALAYAKKVLSVDAYDAGGNFIYGLINKELGRLIDAKDGFGWAARSLEYRSAAYTQIAKINFKAKIFTTAETYAHSALDYNRYNLEVYKLLAVIYRLQKDEQKAQKVLEQLLEIDPLNHFAYFEQYLQVQDQENRAKFTAMIRSELPHETFLELAMTYVNLGLDKEAIQALQMAPSYPTVDYWLAFLHKENAPGKSQSYLTRASKTSPLLVFPFRRETIPVLEWAIEKDNQWKSRYYLGLILWSKGRLEEAGKLFEECKEIPDFSPFYIARSQLFKTLSEKKGETGEGYKKVLGDLRTAIRVDRSQWRAWHTLTNYYNEVALYKQALGNAQKICSKFPRNYILAMDYARALLYNGEYRKCLSILDKTIILPYEGARDGRDIYRQANLLQAVQLIRKGSFRNALRYVENARLWPEHLGVGKPYVTDQRLENYIAALCYEKMGNTDRAKTLYKDICNYTMAHWTQWGSYHYIGAIVLRETGKTARANQLLEEWQKAQPVADMVVRWSIARFNNDHPGILSALKQQKKQVRGTPWNPSVDRDFGILLKALAVLDEQKR